ncbi:MAG: FAD-dependent thymidylate synthase [Gammaproteobacteria bacterium]|nr:FAD-dependent thymidylate synthase [Gammaproteobacteria bacterium]
MRLVKPSHEVISIMNDYGEGITPLNLIEMAGRICYKSEDKMTDESSEKFVKMVTERGHHSVIEHSAMTVKFICDRGVTHELVRHRLCAFSQESTRYCNYKGGVTFVIPPWISIEEGEYNKEELFESNDQEFGDSKTLWLNAMLMAERTYIDLIETDKWSPQQARSVLPNSLKTEIVVTANFREWRHILTLRCSKAAHPQMRELMIPLLEECKNLIPVIFNDITY